MDKVVNHLANFVARAGLKNAIGLVGGTTLLMGVYGISCLDSSPNPVVVWAFVICAILGFLLAVSSVFIRDLANAPMDTNALNIEVTEPRENESVSAPFPVRGKCQKDALGKHYELWVVTESRSASPTRYWPQSKITIHDDGTWNGEVHGLGGEEGSQAVFGIYMVGTDGQALVHYFRDVGRTMREKYKDQAPGLAELTLDIKSCTTRRVVKR
jgi:hypothetical protein